ncbi:MAG: hypothetical protein NC331_11315 [Lachnospiraceae bacterium]|nr:hypothetical protein [Lachnospiraceae bacterium]MCM1239956.1 hypothetical protein [Lachnospiraceae bacterium]
MKKMERILIGERTYPIRIDLNVLEAIQDGYGSVHLFEMDLLGIKIQDGEDGEDGEEQIVAAEPSIRAIRTVLPLMINEGLAVEAADAGRPYEPVDGQRIIQECCIPYDELSRIIHQELKRCFGKKQRPGGTTPGRMPR